MKRFTARFLALCCLMVLASAALAPYVASAQSCPMVVVHCDNGKEYGCAGLPNGDKCSYDANCLNKGRCGTAGTEESSQ